MQELKGLNFNHIGYVTPSISETTSFYENLGYFKTEIVEDSIQRVKICFLKKDGFPVIELVEPMDEKSSVCKLIKKNGVSPYHVCYGVNDVTMAYEILVDQLNFLPLFRPVEASAMDNRMICYLYRKDVGFIELVNNK